jgi:hypothetical protein
VLARAGFLPEVHRVENGYLLSDFVEGRPLSSDSATSALLDRVTAYLRRRRDAFPSNREAPIREIENMVRVNVEEGLGPYWSDRASAASRACRLAAEEGGTTEIDGRMLPHEWLETRDGFLKTDALDHFDDHFFPGSQNLCWDVAGFLTEFEIPQKYASCITSRLKYNHEQLRFYSIAYLSYRIGYCSLASETLGAYPADALRFRNLTARYRRRLKRELA